MIVYQILQTTPPSDIITNIWEYTSSINKNIKVLIVLAKEISKNKLFSPKLLKKLSFTYVIPDG